MQTREMTLEQFIAHKKAVSLAIWAQLREQKKEAYDLHERIKFNWPTLTPAEVSLVVKAYHQRRLDMAKKRKPVPENDTTQGKRPSSPKRPPQYHIRCELGERLYTETFTERGEAKLFLDLIIKPKDNPVKWMSETLLTTKGGVLKISCEELEELMETEEKDTAVRLPENIASQVEAFLRGKWAIKVDDTKTKPPQRVVSRKRAVADNGAADVSLHELCEKNKWNARRVRSAMRDANWSKPAGGSWRWAKSEASAVEKKLKELME